MPPIEVGPARAVGAVDARLARAAGGETTSGAKSVETNRKPAQAATSAGATVETSAALEAGPPPVDRERVDMIRKAVEQGTYPLVPAKIADAIIAAGVLLRSPKQ
jgi:flagellar biosynthesis anti-sigma factor FlgM